ncbi:hypothetical protein KAF25_010405 [Fusarium avenaceum]|uniref:Enoyl reductase (ER) domain-containing protein n=1 Tax=Fusarium avenaceum TaxID=40199 RepID=A0A9P7GS62_9HYPO|nr:hypothetical protein KAF25_010405 [Fusarium avenaceum]
MADLKLEKIPTTMWAWRKHRGNPKPSYEKVPVPALPSNGILCKILASGVCRSDHSLLTIDKQASWFQEKYILGHEGCGQIIGIGNAVQDHGFQVGDIVALHAVPGCGQDDCPECSRDLSQLCERGHHSGIGQDGFYAPYAAVDIRAAVKVPTGVTPAEAAVATDAVNTAYHAITRRGEVKKEETVFLFGLGGLGLNALQILIHIGARVIVSDIRQELLDEAQKLGIPSRDLVPIGTPPQQFIAENDLSGKIDTVLDFVGTHQTFEDAQHIVRRGGKLLCIGSLDTENTIHMKIGTRKRLSFIFSYGGQVRDLKQVLDLIAAGSIKPQVETRKLGEFDQVLQELCDGKIRSRVALLGE